MRLYIDPRRPAGHDVYMQTAPPFSSELHADFVGSGPPDTLVLDLRRRVGHFPVGIRAARIAPDRVRLILEAGTPRALYAAWARLWPRHDVQRHSRLVAP